MSNETGRVVLVTGGTMGIGYAIAERFLKNGDKVVITSRSEKTGKQAEEQLSRLGEVVWLKTDVSDENMCKAAAEFCQMKYGRLDVLINNAGTVGARGDIFHQETENIRTVINTNVFGTIFMTKYAALLMKDQGKGVIVHIGSLAGAIANPDSLAYIASKGAIRMLTQSNARELSPFGIRVVSAAPGWVRTPLLQDLVEKGLEDISHGASRHMKGRILETEEIANVVFFLSGDEASAINGSTVMVDDGFVSFKM